MPNVEKLIALLKSHGFKKTPARIRVLEILTKSSKAVPYSEIEQQLKAIADRVTLYRLLISFEKQGIIHKTHDHLGTVKYAICSSACDAHAHHDEHVHFNCIKCSGTFCLDTVVLPNITLPKGYLANSYQFAITGICKNCMS
ncbi:MAG: transcriptional repressor [Bacteroidetes bacterium]|nr:MAG: transcriptional repressor [Bacteroidota bacterium]